jgi:hypothetical protein
MVVEIMGRVVTYTSVNNSPVFGLDESRAYRDPLTSVVEARSAGKFFRSDSQRDAFGPLRFSARLPRRKIKKMMQQSKLYRVLDFLTSAFIAVILGVGAYVYLYH